MIDVCVRFGRFELDSSQGTLHDPDGRVVLSPLSGRLLAYLIAHRDRVVPFAEVRREVWAGVHIGEAAVRQAVRQLRDALGDDGRQQLVVKTLRGVGYRFVAPVTTRPAGEQTSVPSGRYIGRETMLGDLHAQLESALGGAGRIVLLSGEPGVGKSRTAQEILLAARARDALALGASGGSHSGAPPYWAWSTVFSTLSWQRPAAALRREFEGLAPRFLDAAQGEDAAGRADDVARYQLFDEATRCLERASAITPIVLFFDDLHDAGTGSLELLEFVTRRIGNAPLLILAAYRREQALARADLVETIGRLAQLPSVSSIEIGPLDDAETAHLIATSDLPDGSDSLVARLTQAVRGNPLYAVELTRYLRSRVGEPGSARPDWSETILKGVQHLLAARLAMLSGPARRAIELAACLGVEFDSQVLQRVDPEAELDDAVAEARALGMLICAGRSVRFSHPLIREAVLARLLEDPDHKRRLHLQLSDAYSEREPPCVAEIAFHLAAADPLGDPERTLRALILAAEQAEAVFDDAQAWSLYERAIAISDRGSIQAPALRCRLLIAAGRVGMRTSRSDEACGLLREALAIARRCEEPELVRCAVLGLADRDAYLPTPESDAVEVLEEALEDEAPGDPGLRVGLLAALARHLRHRPGGASRARALMDEALQLAKSVGDAAALAQALEDASMLHWSVEDPAGWIRLNRRIVEAASEARQVGLLFRGVKGLATGYLEIGDRPAAEREMARCAELAAQAPAPFLRALVRLHRGCLALLDGRFDEAETHIAPELQSGLLGIAPLAAGQLYTLRLETGRVGELEPALRSLVESSPEVGAWRFGLARLLVEVGRRDEAAERLRVGMPVAELPRDRNWLLAGALAAETAALLGDERLCTELFETLVPYARVNLVLGHGALVFGNTAHYLGLLAMALGRREQAESLLRSALAMHTQLRSRPWMLRTRIALARNDAEASPPAARAARARELRGEAASLGVAGLLVRELATTTRAR